MKKNFLIILLFCIISNKLFAQDKIFISLTINNVPITNLDIIEEANYLSALNPGIQKINKKEVLSIAKASLIKEKIKEQELKKHFNLNEENEYVDNILKQIYSSLKIESKEEFKNYLIKFDIELKNLIYKINIEARWNELIHNYYSGKFDIDYDGGTSYMDIDGDSNTVSFDGQGYAGGYFYLDQTGSSRTFNIQQQSTLDNDWLKILSTGSSGTVCVIQNDGGTAVGC